MAAIVTFVLALAVLGFVWWLMDEADSTEEELVQEEL